MQNRLERTLFLTGENSKLTRTKANQLIEDCLKEGCRYFICGMKNKTDLLLIQQLKSYKALGRNIRLELVCSDDSLKLSLAEEQQVFQGCDEFCLIDNFTRDKTKQKAYLCKRADRICMI